MSEFRAYVNGRLALSDHTKFAQATEPGNGRIVLGRAYGEVDDFYTSMIVDEAVFYNDALVPADVNQLYRNGF